MRDAPNLTVENIPRYDEDLPDPDDDDDLFGEIGEKADEGPAGDASLTRGPGGGDQRRDGPEDSQNFDQKFPPLKGETMAKFSEDGRGADKDINKNKQQKGDGSGDSQNSDEKFPSLKGEIMAKFSQDPRGAEKTFDVDLFWFFNCKH